MEKRKVLVTGGAGYIGSMTSKQLQSAGYDVTILDNLSTGHKELARFGTLVRKDLLNPHDLEEVFSDGNFDCAVHFAALSLVGESVSDPLKYYRNNICGTRNLLEAMIRNGVTKMVFSSTAAVYGEPESVPIDEENRTQPINPYGKTKLAIEWMLNDATTAHGLNAVALRYFNAAGADPETQCGEWHDPETHLIPNLLRSAAGINDTFKLFGTDYDTPDGTCLRDYVHVYDLANAHKLALDHLWDGGESMSINLGCNQGTSVKQMYDIACNITGKYIPLAEEPRRSGDPASLVASRKKAGTILNWQPKYDDPEAMIAHAWKWYRNKGFFAPES